MRLKYISFFSLFIAACSTSPQPLEYGQDACVYCKMVVSDQRYGAEIVTTKGKVYKFDSIECMAAYYSKQKDLQPRIHSLWSIDFYDHSHWLRAEQAIFTQSSFEKSDGIVTG